MIFKSHKTHNQIYRKFGGNIFYKGGHNFCLIFVLFEVCPWNQSTVNHYCFFSIISLFLQCKVQLTRQDGTFSSGSISPATSSVSTLCSSGMFPVISCYLSPHQVVPDRSLLFRNHKKDSGIFPVVSWITKTNVICVNIVFLRKFTVESLITNTHVFCLNVVFHRNILCYFMNNKDSRCLSQHCVPGECSLLFHE
jgi:hypothetical protein